MTIDPEQPQPRRTHGHIRRPHRASRQHLEGAVRPSPARAEPHDSQSWFPLPDVDELPELDARLATSPGRAPAPPASPDDNAPPPSPARARPHDPAAWLPLPTPEELPSIEELLTQTPWEARPSPARAAPHDVETWFPLGHVGTPPVVETPSAAPEAEPTTAKPPRTRGRARAAAFATLVVVTVLATAFAVNRVVNSATSVQLRVDGRRTTIETGVATVGELLHDQHVELGEFDRVVPKRSAELRDGQTVTVMRAFPIHRDLDGDLQTVYTTYSSPSDFLRRDLHAADSLVIRSAPQRLQADSTIILRTRHSGTLVVDAQAVAYEIPALDVAELLAQYSVELGPEDYVTNRAGQAIQSDSRLTDGEEYSVVRVGRELVQAGEPYSVPDETKPDADLPVGESRVEQGAPGVMNVTYEITRRNGEEVDRKTVSRVPATVASPTVTYYGTKADPIWDRIAQCETGSNWGMQGATFSGGLGFYNGTWDAYGGRDFAPNAGLATREQQIIVAERIRSSAGIGGWGCARALGYVR